MKHSSGRSYVIPLFTESAEAWQLASDEVSVVIQVKPSLMPAQQEQIIAIVEQALKDVMRITAS